jgi:tungstate transport system ATP-binding protein
VSTFLYLLRNIRHIYSGREVLKIDETSFNKGEIVGLTGPNGSGKSTFLRILAFLEECSQGQILFLGQPVEDPAICRKKVTLLLQNGCLLKRSVRDNVCYGLKIRRVSDAQQHKICSNALEMVGLDPGIFGSRKWFELSGGEAQRVSLASRLALRPEVLLLDEPTSSVDFESGELIKSALCRANKEWGTSMIVASHDENWLYNVSHRVISLNRGRLAEAKRRHPAQF